ncbi:hypothetical protein KCU98_g5418, partial [Aureobasidium melanogenum]
MSQACFGRAPWNGKNALVLIANETSWPACLFVLKILIKQIIKLEKQEDPQIMTSKASPHLKTFTGDSDDFRFHHYLDLVCGVSTGGIIATMLGHLRLSLEETVTRITDVLGSVPPAIPKQLILRQEYSSQIHARLHDKMEPKRFKLLLRSCNSPQDACQMKASPFLSVPGMCQTLVLGARERTPSKVYVFRSYRLPEVIDSDFASMHKTGAPVPLVNVCRIAMANPRYREHVKAYLEAHGREEHMVGAANNIDFARLIAEEVQSAYTRTGRLQYLLEIGSRPKKSLSSWRSCWPFNKAQSDRKRLEVKSTMTPKDFEHVQIGNLNELAGYVRSKSTAEAEEYCLAQGLYDKLDSCARVLVESRRARASTIEWEIFAFSDRYLCSVCRKEGHKIDILDKPAFLDHVDFVHDFYDLEPPEMFKIQKESRVEL